MEFDPKTFNWGALLLVISGALILIWLFAVRRGRPGLVRAGVSLAFLLTACQTAAAPFRGLLDPDYIGFGFGLVQAGRGWPVTTASGSVLLLAATAAFLSLRRASAVAAGLSGAVGLAFLCALGPVLLPLIAAEPSSVKMQFGQYLTIPPAGAIPLLLFMQAGYALAAAIAVAALARRARQAQNSTVGASPPR